MRDTYKYSYKCLLCKKQFSTFNPRSDDGNNVCDECNEKTKKKKAGLKDERKKSNNKEGVNGVKKLSKKEKVKKKKEKEKKVTLIEEKKSNLTNSNPKGYNRYKKNPNPKPKNEYEIMTQEERNSMAIKLFQASRKFYRLYKSALARHTFLMSLNDNLKQETVVEEMSDESLLDLAQKLDK